MFLTSLLYNPASLRVALLLCGIILALIAVYLHFRQRKRDLGQAAAQSQASAAAVDGSSTDSQPPPAEPPAASKSPYFYEALPAQRHWLAAALHGGLIVLALVVAVGFVLILLPQGTLDKIASSLQSRNPASPRQETIAFLYLGDEVKEKQFHIRGVVRNISTRPVEQLDAVLRLYASDGALIETVVVRTAPEMIVPDATAEFHLTYPEYKGQFASYSVDFKLRQGEPVQYKDMRAVRSHD